MDEERRKWLTEALTEHAMTEVLIFDFYQY